MDFIILFLIGFSMSTISLVVGSMTPVYVSLMQIFFPGLSLGNIIGADKVSGVARGMGALPSYWNDINWRFLVNIAPLFILGAFLGASIISEISIVWVLPILCIAFFVAEFASYISRIFSKKTFFIFEFLTGVYGGIFGAALKPILLSVLRLKENDDTKIMSLKIQIETLAFFASISAAIAHFFHGTLLLWVIIPLALGNIVGGFIGGKILQKTGKLSGKVQKNIMRASFIIGILTSIWMIYFS